jgi:hypothetical protein
MVKICLTRAVSNLFRLAATCATIVEHTWMISVCANVDKCRGIAVVRVDAGDFTTVTGSDALDVDVALALGAAVAAGAVDLAVVFGVEVDDLEKNSC